MTALAKVLSGLSKTEIDVETLKTLAIFCGVGLLVSLVSISAYSLDLSCVLF